MMGEEKKINSNKALKYYQEGLKCIESLRYYEAVIAFEKAANLSPEKVVYWLELGVAFNRVGQFNEATGAFAAVLLLEPGNEKALFGKYVATHGLPGEREFEESKKILQEKLLLRLMKSASD